MSVCKLAGRAISITWALTWNIARPSIQHHCNSPMVNNHKSNEIHKPLRWCLLSLTLGSSDIHCLEVCAFKPIICSIYAIFPSFYHMNYALCHNLLEHFSSQESYAVLNSFSLLVHHTTRHHLNPLPGALLPSVTGRVTRSDIRLQKAVHRIWQEASFFEQEGAVPIFRTGTWKIDAVYFNSSESLLFFKRRQQTHKGVSAVLKRQIKALQEDIRVCQSWLTFKGPCVQL